VSGDETLLLWRGGVGGGVGEWARVGCLCKGDFVIFVVPCSLTFGLWVADRILLLFPRNQACVRQGSDVGNVDTGARVNLWRRSGLGSGRFLSEKTPRLGLVRESGEK
jgi:hypothetical protein